MNFCSIRNERRTFQELQRVVDKALAKFPNTLEEDTEIVKKHMVENHLTYNEMNCYGQRIADKTVLQEWKELIP